MVKFTGVICLFWCSCTLAGTPAVQMQEVTAVGADGKPLVIDGDPGYSFHFVVDDQDYWIADNGKIIQKIHGITKKKFQLPVPSDMWIAGPVYFANYKDGYLILYETTDAEDGSGGIALIDAKTLSLKWSLDDIPFNIPPGLIADNHVYIAALGFIGSVDLDSGHYAWCINNLYQGANIFVAFGAPRIENDKLLIEDKLSKGSDGLPYFVKVDWESGKVETNAPLSQPARFTQKCKVPKSKPDDRVRS